MCVLVVCKILSGRFGGKRACGGGEGGLSVCVGGACSTVHQVYSIQVESLKH